MGDLTKNEDAIHGSGDVGVQTLAVKNDALATLGGTKKKLAEIIKKSGQAKTRLTEILRASNEEKINLEELVKVNKKQIEANKKLDQNKEIILKSIESFKKQLNSLSCLFGEKNKEVGILTNEEALLKGEIEKLKKDKEKEEEDGKKVTSTLKEKSQRISDDFTQKRVEFTMAEEEKEKRKEKLNTEINIKISRNEEIDKIIVGKMEEIEKLDGEYKIKSDEIIILNNSVEPKEQAIKELKDEISQLEQTKENIENQIKEIKKRLFELEVEKKKADIKLEEVKTKTSSILEREDNVKLSEKRIEEKLKKIGL